MTYSTKGSVGNSSLFCPVVAHTWNMSKYEIEYHLKASGIINYNGYAHVNQINFKYG